MPYELMPERHNTFMTLEVLKFERDGLILPILMIQNGSHINPFLPSKFDFGTHSIYFSLSCEWINMRSDIRIASISPNEFALAVGVQRTVSGNPK